jgi:hypothetical protein
MGSGAATAACAAAGMAAGVALGATTVAGVGIGVGIAPGTVTAFVGDAAAAVERGLGLGDAAVAGTAAALVTGADTPAAGGGVAAGFWVARRARARMARMGAILRQDRRCSREQAARAEARGSPPVNEPDPEVGFGQARP